MKLFSAATANHLQMIHGGKPLTMETRLALGKANGLFPSARVYLGKNRVPCVS